ncbi:MAG TPA: hypothetical protein DCQ43_04680 [Treponema sp.]|nr:hypothetical protein [Treponema sp.]
MAEKRSFDQDQQKTIQMTDNAVVSAGAGSGKTTVLSQRFAYLVFEKHIPVDEILTLTFTNKATVEMYDRIHKTLKEKDPKSVAEFYKANIKTFDSYCASIAKKHSNIYGLAPDFTVDNETLTEAINKKALSFLLAHEKNTAIQALVQTKDSVSIAEELFAEPILTRGTISCPIDFESDLEKQKEHIIQKWNIETENTLSLYKTLLQLLNDFEGNRNSATFIQIVENAQKELPEDPLLDSSNFTKTTSDAMFTFAMSITLLSSKLPGSLKGSNIGEIKDTLKALRNQATILYSLANYVYAFPLIQQLIPLLSEFQEIVNDTKRSLKAITYADAASIAMCILRDYPEYRKIEKQRFKAIMIDEFQDNNMAQRDLLFMLAEKPDRMEKGIPSAEDLCPDKLFFVGDEKQSIYRFRGADVSVFRGLSKDFADGNISLKTNYRSHPALIAAFNTIFGGIAYPTDTDQKRIIPSAFFNEAQEKDHSQNIADYEAVYHTVLLPKALEENKKDIDYSPRIHIVSHLQDDTENNESNEDSVSKDEQEATWVAEKICELLKQKKYKETDIAILFRSYALQPLYERTFLSYGIPYSAEVATGFFNDGPTNDLFAFLRLCAYPQDTLAYAQVLHSPFVNLSMEETEKILAQLPEQNKMPFSELSEDQLCEDSLRRYKKAAQEYQHLYQKAGTVELTQLVSELWFNFGYRFETEWNQTVSMYATMYDRIFELARLADMQNTSLAEFVDSVRVYSDEKAKLENMDIPLEQKNGVHLLSIHKSKGLEYPVVFICGAGKRGAADSNKNAVYISKQYGITFNTPPNPLYKGKDNKTDNYFYNLAKEENNKMAGAELRRLMYVAITRAKEEVYITGITYEKEDTSFEKLPGNATAPTKLQDIIKPAIMFYQNNTEAQAFAPFTFEEIEVQAKSNKKTQQRTRTQFIEQFSSLIENAQVLQTENVKSLYLSPSHLADEQKEADKSQNTSEVPYKEINEIVESSDNRFGYNDFGTIAHAFMESAINGTEVSVSQNAYAGIDDSETKKKKINAICQEMKNKFLQSELGQKAIQSKWHRCEYSFRDRIDNFILKGQIDLVFKNEDETYTLVDYKTNQTVEPEEYKEQLACYRHALCNMLNCKESDIRCVLYYLRFAKEEDISNLCETVDIKEAVKRASDR